MKYDFSSSKLFVGNMVNTFSLDKPRFLRPKTNNKSSLQKKLFLNEEQPEEIEEYDFRQSLMF